MIKETRNVESNYFLHNTKFISGCIKTRKWQQQKLIRINHTTQIDDYSNYFKF